MMKTENIPLGLLIFLTMTAAIIITAFWLLRRYVLPLIRNRQTGRTAATWLLRMEALAWSLFAIFAVYRLLLASPVVTLIFVALITVLGWNFWKDFFSGLLFRLERKAETGDIIHFDRGEDKMQEGIVQKISGRSVTIRRTDGETLVVPFHRLDGAVISKSHPEGNLVRHTFIVDLQADNPGVKAELKKILYECPWSVPAQDPVIENLGSGRYQITGFAADKEAGERLVGYVRRRISKPHVNFK